MAVVRNLAWPGAVIMQTGIPQLPVDPVIPNAEDAYYETLATGPSYDDDAAAAAGGIAVGERYRNGNFLMVRLA